MIESSPDDAGSTDVIKCINLFEPEFKRDYKSNFYNESRIKLINMYILGCLHDHSSVSIIKDKMDRFNKKILNKPIDIDNIV